MPSGTDVKGDSARQAQQTPEQEFLTRLEQAVDAYVIAQKIPKARVAATVINYFDKIQMAHSQPASPSKTPAT